MPSHCLDGFRPYHLDASSLAKSILLFIHYASVG